MKIQVLLKMNIKKYSKKLEKFYSEVKDEFKLTVLPNGSVAYRDYLVKQKSNGTWDLVKVRKSKEFVIENFNLKTCALVSAKQHFINNLQQLIETKQLDNLYWNAHTDSVYFKHFYNKSNDPVKKDTLLWRHEITTQRAAFYKQKISQAFSCAFR